MTDAFIAGLAALTLIAALIVAMTGARNSETAERQRNDQDPQSKGR